MSQNIDTLIAEVERLRRENAEQATTITRYAKSLRTLRQSNATLANVCAALDSYVDELAESRNESAEGFAIYQRLEQIARGGSVPEPVAPPTMSALEISDEVAERERIRRRDESAYDTRGWVFLP